MGVRLFKTYILLLVAGFLAMLSVHFVSHESVQEHIRRSVTTIQEQGNYPRLLGCALLRIDNFTDALMLNMSYCADTDKPLEAALSNIFFTDEEMNVFNRTQDLVRGDTLQGHFQSYGRYWHGHQLILRPLLTSMDYVGVLRLNKVCFYGLLLLCLIVVARRLSVAASLAMLASLVLVGLPAIPMCLQYSTTFYIALLSVIAVLIWPRLTREKDDAFNFFFVIGALTSYFDFLTTPQVALGFPLTVCLLIHRNWRKVRYVVQLTVSWLSGYALLWLSKCVLAQLLTPYDIIGSFFRSVRVRTIAGMDTLVTPLAGLMGERMAYMLIVLLCLLVLLFIVFVLYVWRRLSRDTAASPYRWLLAIALITPVSYVLALQHAVIHYWFVWRALSVTFLCLFLFVYFIIRHSHEEDSRSHSLL